jgi:DNA-binding SARP family transcriptional activator/tetratricopeptide (TPR) repeat protein
MATAPGAIMNSSLTTVMSDIRLHLFGEASIQIGDEVIGPAAPHLFALLLLLTLAPADGVSRQELREFLFGRTEERAASQRLRQLLYRLRQLGVELCDTAGGALRVGNAVVEVVAASSDDTGPLRALPHYRPRLPKAFLAWLEQTRERLEQRTQTQLVRELREAHRRQDWSKASGLATVVLAADPLNEEVAAAGVEARAMLGKRDEALELADRFVREVEGDEPAAAAMRRLRARIAKTSPARREGTLRGREECLQLLADQWELAAEGSGRVCLVVGPAGMGKTRVAETFAAKVRLGGGRVVTYRCDRQVSQHPLALFSAILPELQALPGSLGVSPEHRATLERLAPSTAAPAAESLGSMIVEARRTELQHALLDLLEAISAERPVLLVVDDAHLLDEASSEVLRTLADSEGGVAILMAGFSRPRGDGNSRLANSRRTTLYVLPPLSDADAHDLLLEMCTGRPPTAEQAAWTLTQAKGNPFYVHALASATNEEGTLPMHVRSMATFAYFALSPQARTVLECCLLLETLATLSRVRLAGGIDDHALLSALRELEEADLVRLDGTHLRGPHAILDEVMRQLIPASVAALLHVRIAESLAAECASGGYAMALAWAAVQSWLAAGNPQAAVSLACRTAREAAELGEPHAGAELLSRVPRSALPSDCQRQLLYDLSQLANAACSQSFLNEVLQERLALATDCNEGMRAKAATEIQIVAQVFHSGGDGGAAISRLNALVHDETLSVHMRYEAGRRLLAFADTHYEAELATRTFSVLEAVTDPNKHENVSFANASLVYHSSFGSRDDAFRIVSTVSSLAGVDDGSTALLTNASMALVRLGHYAEAKDLAVSTFKQMIAKGIVSAAEFALSMITEAELALGNLASASHWLEEWRELTTRNRFYGNRYVKSLASTSFLCALYEERYVEAESLLSRCLALSPQTWPRIQATLVACQLLLSYRLGRALQADLVEELRALYARRPFGGGHDASVEALWCASMHAGRAREASQLLHEYLTVHRRERGTPEWSLRRTTARDPAWAGKSYVE